MSKSDPAEYRIRFRFRFTHAKTESLQQYMMWYFWTMSYDLVLLIRYFDVLSHTVLFFVDLSTHSYIKFCLSYHQQFYGRPISSHPIYLAFTKWMSHTLSCHKIRQFGTCGNLHSWSSSFLSKWKHGSSSWLPIHSSGPLVVQCLQVHRCSLNWP